MRKFISTKPVMTAAIIFSICVITLFFLTLAGKWSICTNLVLQNLL